MVVAAVITSRRFGVYFVGVDLGRTKTPNTCFQTNKTTEADDQLFLKNEGIHRLLTSNVPFSWRRCRRELDYVSLMSTSRVASFWFCFAFTDLQSFLTILMLTYLNATTGLWYWIEKSIRNDGLYLTSKIIHEMKWKKEPCDKCAIPKK